MKPNVLTAQIPSAVRMGISPRPSGSSSSALSRLAPRKLHMVWPTIAKPITATRIAPPIEKLSQKSKELAICVGIADMPGSQVCKISKE